jgi:hypothetical protein
LQHLRIIRLDRSPKVQPSCHLLRRLLAPVDALSIWLFILGKLEEVKNVERESERERPGRDSPITQAFKGQKLHTNGEMQGRT